MIDIKHCVKHPVIFQFYKDGCLWYNTANLDEFPVPVEDIGNATFRSLDKGILFMRYMRRWNEALEKEKET
jgi:hypothetical protein